MKTPKRTAWKIFALVAVVGAGTAVLLPQTQSAAAAPVPQVLQKLQDTRGKPAGNYLKKDKPTLIKFWASWCPLCLSELSHTEAWAKDSRFQTANLITVASPGFLGEKKPGEFRQWYAGLNYPKLPVIADDGGTIAKSLNIGVGRYCRA